MAKPVAPLLSFSADGQIAKSLVYSSWKGRPYVRRYVVPSNPNTTAQQATRNAFTSGNSFWKGAGTLARAPWTLFAQGQVLTDRNAYQGRFVTNLRGETDMLLYEGSPGAKGGLAPTSIAVTPGSNQLSIAFTNPTPPAGWTLVSAIATAILDQDPAAPTDFTITEAEDAATQATVVLTGLTPSVLYTVQAWLEWTKPDGSTAYGPSIQDSDTPTA
jgi:hypothetical protein